MLQRIQLALSVGLAVIACLLLSPDEAFSQDPFYTPPEPPGAIPRKGRPQNLAL